MKKKRKPRRRQKVQVKKFKGRTGIVHTIVTLPDDYPIGDNNAGGEM